MKALGLVAHPWQACRCKAKDGNWAKSLCEERNASFSIRTNKVSQCFTRACSPSWRLPAQSSGNSLFPMNRKQPWRTSGWPRSFLLLMGWGGVGGWGTFSGHLSSWCGTIPGALVSNCLFYIRCLNPYSHPHFNSLASEFLL